MPNEKEVKELYKFKKVFMENLGKGLFPHFHVRRVFDESLEEFIDPGKPAKKEIKKP